MSVQGVLTQLTPGKATHLNQCLVFQGDLAIVADLPERGSKAPLVSGHTQVLGVFNTLRSDPWDSFYALWKRQEKFTDQFLQSPGEHITAIAARTGSYETLSSSVFQTWTMAALVLQGVCERGGFPGLSALAFPMHLSESGPAAVSV